MIKNAKAGNTVAMDTTQMFKMMETLNRQNVHSCHCIYNLAQWRILPFERSYFSYDFEVMIAFSGVDNW